MHFIQNIYSCMRSQLNVHSVCRIHKARYMGTSYITKRSNRDNILNFWHVKNIKTFFSSVNAVIIKMQNCGTLLAIYNYLYNKDMIRDTFLNLRMLYDLFLIGMWVLVINTPCYRDKQPRENC